MEDMDHSLLANSQTIMRQVDEAITRRPQEFNHDVTVIAVSKRHPVSSIVEAYEYGLREFGENYVAELFDKANNEEILQKCPEIRWHFIGHLQSNKVSKLLACPNLFRIQTIDSVKIADMVQKQLAKMDNPPIIYVMIQVNTSGELTKSGVLPEDALELVEHVDKRCPRMVMSGLMTLGAPNYDVTKGPNPDFVTLKRLKEVIHEALGLNMLLSMGTSADFEHAIELGSNFVRVGEKLFGPRPN